MLFVVNGIFINNSIGGNNCVEGNLEMDYGNGVGEINVDDIEFIFVLKGVNVIVLYGFCVVNGVILVIIKLGVVIKGIGVSFNLMIIFENVLRIFEY